MYIHYKENVNHNIFLKFKFFIISDYNAP